MAFVVSKIPVISFTNNAPDFIISEENQSVFVSISLAGSPIVSDMELTPDPSGKITVDVRQIVRNIQPLSRPESVLESLPSITITSRKTGEALALSGYLIPGGVYLGSGFDIDNFLASNFLTWQPQIIRTSPDTPQWLAFIRPSDTFLSFSIWSNLYTSDGRVFTKQIQSTPNVRVYCQVDTSYKALWMDHCTRNDITPIAYDVYGKLSRQSSDGTSTQEYSNRPFAQRYVLRSSHINELCFGFSNTLGGFDTIIMRGNTVLEPEGEVQSFVNRNSEVEIFNEYTSHWEASSGYIDSERLASQYQDFLKSSNRYLFYKERWLRIVVDEFDLKHTKGELNAYTFKYHFSERNEDRFYQRTELPDVELPFIQ